MPSVPAHFGFFYVDCRLGTILLSVLYFVSLPVLAVWLRSRQETGSGR